MSSSPTFQPLQCATIGAGLDGLCAAIALRWQGHFVTIYERYDFAGEIGVGMGIVSNGTYFLEKQWNVDMSKVKPVVLKKLVRHDWKTGEVQGETPVGDYKAKFGTDYYAAFRIDIHSALLDEALQEDGEGPPYKLLTNHRLVGLEPETGICKFENGVKIQADIIVGALGIKSQVRRALDITPEVQPSKSCYYRMFILSLKLKGLGLGHTVKDPALQFWGCMGIDRFVAGPARNGDILCCYAFYPAEKNDLREDGWHLEASPRQLLGAFPEVDPDVRKLFLHAEDIKQWRIFIHPEYPYWQKGKASDNASVSPRPSLCNTGLLTFRSFSVPPNPLSSGCSCTLYSSLNECSLRRSSDSIVRQHHPYLHIL